MADEKKKHQSLERLQWLSALKKYYNSTNFTLIWTHDTSNENLHISRPTVHCSSVTRLFQCFQKESKVPQNSQISFLNIFSNYQYEKLKFFHFWSIRCIKRQLTQCRVQNHEQQVCFIMKKWNGIKICHIFVKIEADQTTFHNDFSNFLIVNL